VREKRGEREKSNNYNHNLNKHTYLRSSDFAAMSASTLAYCLRYKESCTKYLAIMSLIYMITLFQSAYVPCINTSTRTNVSDARAHTQTHTLEHRDRNKHMRTKKHILEFQAICTLRNGERYRSSEPAKSSSMNFISRIFV